MAESCFFACRTSAKIMLPWTESKFEALSTESQAIWGELHYTKLTREHGNDDLHRLRKFLAMAGAADGEVTNAAASGRHKMMTTGWNGLEKIWQNRKRLNMTWAVTCYDELAKVAKVNDSRLSMSQWAFEHSQGGEAGIGIQSTFGGLWQRSNPQVHGSAPPLTDQFRELRILGITLKTGTNDGNMRTTMDIRPSAHTAIHCCCTASFQLCISLHIFASCESMALAHLLARNDNSSRFGKFIELQFRTSGKARQMEKYGACFGDLGRICGAQ